jgi:hypothetical protein
MRSRISNIVAVTLLIGAISALSACGKKDAAEDTNVVALNAMDGSMNDMTAVDAAMLDAAGSAVDDSAVENGAGDNTGNAN